MVPDPKLTNNGTSSNFAGTLTTRAFDLDALGYSGFTLTSIDFGTAGSASGNTAIFAVSGTAAAVPEPAPIAIWSLIGLGLAGFGYYRTRRKK